MDARVVLQQLRAGPADLETFDRHIVGPDGHHVRAAVADEVGTTVTDERHRPGDCERTGVDTGRNVNRLARRRGRQPVAEPGAAIAGSRVSCPERNQRGAQCQPRAR